MDTEGSDNGTKALWRARLAGAAPVPTGGGVAAAGRFKTDEDGMAPAAPYAVLMR